MSLLKLNLLLDVGFNYVKVGRAILSIGRNQVAHVIDQAEQMDTSEKRKQSDLSKIKSTDYWAPKGKELLQTTEEYLRINENLFLYLHTEF